MRVCASACAGVLGNNSTVFPPSVRFGRPSFPLQQQFSTDLLPQLWSTSHLYLAANVWEFSCCSAFSIFFFFVFSELSPSVTYSLQVLGMIYIIKSIESLPLVHWQSSVHTLGNRIYVYIFPLLISESVWNWFNMQIEFCQLNLYIFFVYAYIHLINLHVSAG